MAIQKKAYGFLVILVGVFILWFISKYKGVFEDDIQLKVKWQDVPSDIQINKSEGPLLIDARVRQRGFKLLWNKLGATEVELDFQAAIFSRNDSIFYNPKSGLPELRENNEGLNILDVEDSDYYVPITRFASKKIQLTKDFLIRYEKNFQLIEEVGFVPDSIILYGDVNVLKSINQMEIKASPLTVNDTPKMIPRFPFSKLKAIMFD